MKNDTTAARSNEEELQREVTVETGKPTPKLNSIDEQHHVGGIGSLGTSVERIMEKASAPDSRDLREGGRPENTQNARSEDNRKFKEKGIKSYNFPKNYETEILGRSCRL